MSRFSELREKVRHMADRVQYQEKGGRLEANGHRRFTLSGRAFGRLRQELIKTLGEDLARGALKRYGYQAGFDDAHYLCLEFPGTSLEEQMHLGTLLHQRAGAAMVETIEEETRVDIENGVLEISSRWHNSIEAEQHLEQIGASTTPVCWSLTGYAAGHLSFLLQKEVSVVETSCVAQDRLHCSFRAGFKDDMQQKFPGCEDDYQSIDLLAMLDDLGRRMEDQNRQISRLKARESREAPSAFARLTGESAAMRKVVETGRVVAGVDSTVLIIGESGTGKELLARALHESSPRARKPYVTVNCATLTESLQNAELFGYVRGAFTGANRDKAGLFEDANGGTLFLDEVGELSLSAQAALLRVLQEGRVSRVGETRERKVDVRVLAATHRSLDRMVADKSFRQDLFFRMNVIRLRLPPLRERENDVLLLANHFMALFAHKFHKNVDGMSPELVRVLLQYSWPGNVRELQNAMERAVLLSAGSLLRVEDLPDCLVNPVEANSPNPASEPVTQPVPPYDEKAALEAAMRATGGVKQAAADILGINRTTLWRKIKKFGLRTDKGYWRRSD